MDDLSVPFCSATQLSQLLQQKKISARELLDLYLARIDTENVRYNAVIALDIQAARDVAHDVDDRRAGGKHLGALAGLPMTIKDSFEVVGMVTACGLPRWRSTMPSGMPRRSSGSERLTRSYLGRPTRPRTSAIGRPTTPCTG